MVLNLSSRHGFVLAGLILGCEASTPPPSATAARAATASSHAEVVTLPGARPGIGFDDLRFCSFPGSFDAVVVPAGRTGNVDFIDPISAQVMSLGGFSTEPTYRGANDFGVTSADGDFDGLFAVDRTSKKLFLADPVAKKIVGSAPLAGEPAYVRYFIPFRQVWVTEPKLEQVELFNMPTVGDMTAAFVNGGAPVRDAVIAVKGEPRAFIFDIDRTRAYTNLRSGATVSIDVTSQEIVATWPNGCAESRGIDLDMKRGLLFVGCAEGKAVVLDAKTGSQVGSITTGGGGAIAFAEGLRHLYFPSSAGGTMAVLGVSEKGDLSLLGTVPTAVGAHCVAADAHGNAYVCDPDHGSILRIRDPYPATP